MIEESAEKQCKELLEFGNKNLSPTIDQDEKRHAQNGIHFEANAILENFEKENLAAKASTPINNNEEIETSPVKNGKDVKVEEAKVKRKNPKQEDKEIAATTFNKNTKAKYELNLKKPTENGSSFEKVGNSVFYVESCSDRGNTGNSNIIVFKQMIQITIVIIYYINSNVLLVLLRP